MHFIDSMSNTDFNGALRPSWPLSWPPPPPHTSKWGHDMLVLQACTVRILDRIMHCSLINLNRLRYLLTGSQLVMRRILTATCLLDSKYWQTEASFWRKLNEWQYMIFFFDFFLLIMYYCNLRSGRYFSGWHQS